MIGRFTIQGRLAGLNDIIGKTNASRWAGADLKKKETQKCQWAILSGSVPSFKNPVRVSFRWIEKDYRRDPDNICAGAKFCLDALVGIGRIPNDTRRWVKGISHEFPEPDKKNPRVEVTIFEDADSRQ